MAIEVILPRVDMEMTEGKIAAWYVKNGDAVTKGQVLFDIETDKAAMEVDAPAAGVIDGIRGEVGVVLPVGEIVGWIRAKDERLPTATLHTDAPAPAPADAPEPTRQPDAAALAGDAAAPATDAPEPLRATPLARTLAHERGIALASLQGSGPAGRIVADDVPDLGKAARAFDAPLNLQWLARRNGVPVVMLHGFGTDHASWRPLAVKLETLSLVGIDLPNHGKSPTVDTVDIDDVVELVMRRLHDEGIGDCHLVGHSLGGAVAMGLSQRLGSRLRSLTLLAPAGLGPDIRAAFIDGLCHASSEAAAKPWLRELFHDRAALTASFTATAFHQIASDVQRTRLAAMAAALMPNGTQASWLRPLLDDLDIPTKVIWGAADRIIPVAHAQGLPGHVALHVLPSVGHLPQVEAIDLVARLIAEQTRAATPHG